MRLPRRHGDRALPGQREQRRDEAGRDLDLGREVQDRRAGASASRARSARTSTASGRSRRPPPRCGASRASALPHGALAAVAATKLTGGAKASLTIVLVPRGPNVAVLTLTSQTGFNPYPQARNLMRRMLGLKPIAAAKKPADAAADRRAGRDRALRAPPESDRRERAGTVAERAARGRAARAAVPRSSHASYDPPAESPRSRRHPRGAGRRPRAARLVPIRYGRMLASPFAFYRGAAAIMAADLAATPRSGFDVQCCGDAHLSNFGLFGSPERRLVFDINDFDETLPGPVGVGRQAARGEPADRGARARVRAARSGAHRARHRRRVPRADGALRGQHATWTSGTRGSTSSRSAPSSRPRSIRRRASRPASSSTKARTRDSLDALSKLTRIVDGAIAHRLAPAAARPASTSSSSERGPRRWPTLHGVLQIYRRSLQANRRVLLESYELADLAHKVVGVGSVGTQAWIALLLGRDDGDPLFLQIKEAQASVLEAHPPQERATATPATASSPGQRLMQATSDIFLGWLSVKRGAATAAPRDFYVRQLRDWKGSVDVAAMTPEGLRRLRAPVRRDARARPCALAAIASRSPPTSAAAARSTRPILAFSDAYADQNERDYAALAAAVASGRVSAETGL